MRVSDICRILCGVSLAVVCCVPAAAQQKPVYYNSVCLKVKPGRGIDFTSQLNGNVLKLEQSQLKAGVIRSFLVMSNVIPSGKKAPCDYIVDTFYDGLPPAPGMSDKEFTGALHRAGLDITPAEFWAPIIKDVTLVSQGVGEVPVLVGGSKKGDYVEVTEMHVKDQGACLNTEEKLWQPVAEARIKAGEQSGWGVWQIVLPRGTKVQPNEGTVDIYSSWDGIFNQGIGKTWQEVHPDLKITDAMVQFNQDCKIQLSPIYKVVEDVQAPMQ